MNLLERAIDDTVDSYEDGRPQLAELMGMGTQVLSNKACPTNEGSHFSPQQLANLQRITGNYSINDALVAMQEKTTAKGVSIELSLLDLTDKLGETVHEAKKALEDGHVDLNESIKCLKPLNELIEQAEVLKNRFHHAQPQVKAVG